jgi:hypothetical protein
VAMDVAVAMVGVAVVLVIHLEVPLAVPAGAQAPTEALAPAAVATTVPMGTAMAMAMVVATVLEVEEADSAQAALNKVALPWRTTRRPSSTLCETTVPPMWLVRTWKNKPSPAPQLRRSKPVAAMVKYNLYLQATIGTLAGQVGAAQAAAAAANVAAANGQAVATAAGNADCFRPFFPCKYGNKKKDADVKQWIPIIENYLRTAQDADYIRLASSLGPIWRVVRDRCGPVL